MEFLDKLSDLEKRIGELERANFMPFKEFQCGKTDNISNPSQVHPLEFSVTFDKEFNEVPSVVASAEEGTDYMDSFGVTIRYATTTGFVGYIFRASEYGWSQSGL